MCCRSLHLPLPPVAALVLLGVGLVLGILRARSGSILPGLALHMAWNGILVGLLGLAFLVGQA